MTRTHIILFSLLFLCLQAQTYSLPFLSNPPMEITPTINAYSGTSGEIDIKKDPNGFYVEADFVYNDIWPFPPKTKPDPLPQGTVKMMISLSNSETIATSSCLNFTNYDTVKYNYYRTIWEDTISYPNFLAATKAGHGLIYLDRKYWTLILSTLSVTVPNLCATGANASSIGSDRSGVIGLGTHQTETNFKISKNFSVYIKSDLSSGKLIFNNDTNNYTISSEPLYNLSANAHWRLVIPQGSLEIKNYSTAFDNYTVIFDVNTDAIGLPSDLFKSFMSNFSLASNISCSSDLYRPSCNTTASIQELPDIFISFNDTKIRIPFKIYATPDGKSSFKLNLKATSPDLSGPSYVTTLFNNSIILGTPFMSYYFTVFDGTKDSNVISLYISARGNNTGPTPTPNRWIIIGAVVLVFVAIIGCCAKRKVATNKLIENIAKEESLTSNYASYN